MLPRVHLQYFTVRLRWKIALQSKSKIYKQATNSDELSFFPTLFPKEERERVGLIMMHITVAEKHLDHIIFQTNKTYHTFLQKMHQTHQMYNKCILLRQVSGCCENVEFPHISEINTYGNSKKLRLRNKVYGIDDEFDSKIMFDLSDQ